MIKTTPVEAEWLDGLKGRGFTADTIFDEGQYEPLKKILLGLGGEAVVLPRIEPDYHKIFVKGQVMLPKFVKVRKGRPCSCHQNVAQNCLDYGWMIFTGYALSKDGVWRQHSWNYDYESVVETTEKRVAYYGFPLDMVESAEFVKGNLKIG